MKFDPEERFVRGVEWATGDLTANLAEKLICAFISTCAPKNLMGVFVVVERTDGDSQDGCFIQFMISNSESILSEIVGERYCNELKGGWSERGAILSTHGWALDDAIGNFQKTWRLRNANPRTRGDRTAEEIAREAFSSFCEAFGIPDSAQWSMHYTGAYD